MTPDPTGGKVTKVEYLYRLSIETDDGWYLTVENDFVLQEPGSDSIDSATRMDEALSRLESHVGGRFHTFDVRPGGGLSVGIDELTMLIESAYDFEAWDIVGPPPAKQRIICMPGGELAIWS